MSASKHGAFARSFRMSMSSSGFLTGTLREKIFASPRCRVNTTGMWGAVCRCLATLSFVSAVERGGNTNFSEI